jgi:hypothetical protein
MTAGQRPLHWPPNFSEREFNRQGLSPIAPQHRGNMLAVAWVLQGFRNSLFDGRPVTVTNAYRTPADFDRLVAAGFSPSRTSAHFDGLAVDFTVQGLTAQEVQRRLRHIGWGNPQRMPNTGLGLGQTFTHLSLWAEGTFNY